MSQTDEEFDARYEAEQKVIQADADRLTQCIEVATSRMKLGANGGVILDQETLCMSSEPDTSLREYLKDNPDELKKARFIIRNHPEDDVLPYEIWQTPEIEHGDYVLLVNSPGGVLKFWMKPVVA